MKNSEEPEMPTLSLERSPLLLILAVVASVLISWLCYYLFEKVNPWAFFVMVPAAILSFQTLWMLLHPFARVFKDKIEIKHSLFSNKQWYFIDIKKVVENKSGRVYVVYHDDEVEPLNLRGIKPAHVSLLRAEIEKNIRQVS